MPKLIELTKKLRASLKHSKETKEKHTLYARRIKSILAYTHLREKIKNLRLKALTKEALKSPLFRANESATKDKIKDLRKILMKIELALRIRLRKKYYQI